MPPAISIRNLGKCYRVNHAVERAPYRTLRDSLARAATAPLRRMRAESNSTSEAFWALKDVDLDIHPGEVVGIIGRNGAGKSTLLKVLSRITSPTTGEVAISGRVGSLLEVGTGFHPELTGRENIYLNGSVLGMSHRQICARLDEIVDFSGVERFLDTPVKRYSSGMYVRLAFAVAAHTVPDILVIDEVLAVGDADFQRKCLGKMSDVARDGRTVLFVSHNLEAVERLCSRAIVLANASVHFDGDAHSAISHFTHTGGQALSNRCLSDRSDRIGSGSARFVNIQTRDSAGNSTSCLDLGSSLTIDVQIAVDAPVSQPQCAIIISTIRGQRLLRAFTADWLPTPPPLVAATTLSCRLRDVNLLPGEYQISLKLLSGPDEIIDHIDDAHRFEIIARRVVGAYSVPGSPDDVVFLYSEWSARADSG